VHRTHFDFMRFYFLYYIMITKFNCKENFNSIEFKREVNTLIVSISEYETDNYFDVTLSEQDLFSLIGQLLRIQSEIRAEVKNG
jgi:hypothetical protein